MRALAVIIVILFHLEVSWLPGGFVGVDVFFVISGFLITSLIVRQIEAGSFSLVDFYERRFRRIYPNLLIVLAATMALGWFTLMPETYRFFGRTLVWASLSASNFTFIGGNGYFDPVNITKPLLHTWSLGVEEQFYLVFPWLLILAVRLRYRTEWLIGGMVVLSLALSIGAAIVGWSPSYFLLPTRFWELGTGAMVAIVPMGNRMTPARRSALGLAGLAGIIWAALSLSESDSFPGYLALAPTLGAAALIVANGGAVNGLMALPPFAWIGRLSYALYLWHWPLISVAAGIGLSPKETTTRVAVVVGSLFLSVIGYHLWETPIRQRRLMPSRRALFAALSACVVFFVGSGILLYTTKGFPQRLPKELLALYEIPKQGSRLVQKRCPLANLGKPYVCPIGEKDSDQVSFIIIGDSHSEAVAAEIGDVASHYGLHGLYLGKRGCRLFVEPATSEDDACIPQSDLALKTFQETRPKLVIIIARWTSDLNESRMTESKYDSMARIFDTTLDIFGSTTVVTALTVPEYDVNILETGVHAWFQNKIGLAAPPIPTLPMAKYRQRQAPVEKFLDEARMRHPNLSIVDPTTALCQQGTCISELENRPLYYDDNHLSHAGALLYAPLFAPYLEELARTLADRTSAAEMKATAIPTQTKAN